MLICLLVDNISKKNFFSKKSITIPCKLSEKYPKFVAFSQKVFIYFSELTTLIRC